jgi:hypothetical protein
LTLAPKNTTSGAAIPAADLRMTRQPRRKPMNLKPVQLRLETEEVRQILQVALDEDAQQAMAFVKNVLAKKVEKALQRH